jgi:hypothetical protein
MPPLRPRERVVFGSCTEASQCYSQLHLSFLFRSIDQIIITRLATAYNQMESASQWSFCVVAGAPAPRLLSPS